MKKILLAALLSIFLVACYPPDPEPTDPTPPAPEPPVVEVSEIEGIWEGNFSFLTTDTFGNEESLVILSEMSIYDNDGFLNGTLVFFTSQKDTCDLSGEVSESTVSLIAICEGINGISILGEVDLGVFSGGYDVTSDSFVIEDGDFYLTYRSGLE